MESLKNIIVNCSIEEYRSRLKANRQLMSNIESKLLNMRLNWIVGKYIYHLDHQKYLQEKEQLTASEEKELLESKTQVLLLQDDPCVMAYRELEDKYFQLKRECSEYYQVIQLVFREELKKTSLPNVFVHQGFLSKDKNLKRNRHIVLKDAYEDYRGTTPNVVVYPMQELLSKRDARRFYNRVSFQYLEQLSQDEDFSIKTKKLGSIKIEENGRRI